MFAAVRLGVGSVQVCVIVNIVQGLQNLTVYAQWVHSSLMTCHLGHRVWLFFIALSIFAPLIASSSFCRGFISLGERSYVLEPCADRSDGTHWIYTAEHLNFAPGTCGHDFNTTYSSAHTDGSPFKAFSTRVRIIFSTASKLSVCSMWFYFHSTKVHPIQTGVMVWTLDPGPFNLSFFFSFKISPIVKSGRAEKKF